MEARKCLQNGATQREALLGAMRKWAGGPFAQQELSQQPAERRTPIEIGRHSREVVVDEIYLHVAGFSRQLFLQVVAAFLAHNEARKDQGVLSASPHDGEIRDKAPWKAAKMAMVTPGTCAKVINEVILDIF